MRGNLQAWYFSVIALPLSHVTANWVLRCQAAVREPVYTGGKVIGIAERTKIKIDSSLIFQFLYLFFRFYTVIVLDYFSVTVTPLLSPTTSVGLFFPFSTYFRSRFRRRE